MDIQAVRRRVLQRLIDEQAGGNKAEFGRKYEIDAGYLSQLLGEHRSIGEKSAIRLEDKIGLSRGYLGDPDNLTGMAAEAASLDAPAGASVRMHTTKRDLDPEVYEFIPMFEVKLSAGNGISNVSWIERSEDDQLSFRKAWFKKKGLHPESCKAMYVRGRSMEPKLDDRDTVMIDTSDTEQIDGEIYAVVYRNQFYIKTLERIGAGIRLRSENPEFSSIDVSEDDMEYLKVLGRKVWRAG